jgi:hypothetical protein
MDTLKQMCIASGKYCWYCWGLNCDKHISHWLVEYRKQGIIK